MSGLLRIPAELRCMVYDELFAEWLCKPGRSGKSRLRCLKKVHESEPLQVYLHGLHICRQIRGEIIDRMFGNVELEVNRIDLLPVLDLFDRNTQTVIAAIRIEAASPGMTMERFEMLMQTSPRDWRYHECIFRQYGLRPNDSTLCAGIRFIAEHPEQFANLRFLELELDGQDLDGAPSVNDVLLWPMFRYALSICTLTTIRIGCNPRWPPSKDRVQDLEVILRKKLARVEYDNIQWASNVADEIR